MLSTLSKFRSPSRSPRARSGYLFDKHAASFEAIEYMKSSLYETRKQAGRESIFGIGTDEGKFSS